MLVTGATGFIGRRLAEMLLQAGHRVRVLVRRPERLAHTLDPCEVVRGDLADADVLRRAVRDVSVIYHCAANVATWDNWESYAAANITGLKNLLEAVLAENPALERFVHFSTVDVYGFPESPCDEDCPLPKSPFGYSESKRQGEALVRRFAREHGLPVTILRPCNVIGPGSQFIERIGAELRAGLMLKVDGGRANAGLIYVDNLARYAMCLVDADEAVGEVFNVRDPYDVDWNTFLRDLKAGIRGRGLVISLPFWLADGAARLITTVCGGLCPGREPLLHPLLVRIFGRSCGHDAGRLHRLCALPDAVDYPAAVERSCAWFLERH